MFLWKGNEKHQSGARFFVHLTIVSGVKGVEFVSDKLSYIVLRRSLVYFHCSEFACTK